MKKQLLFSAILFLFTIVVNAQVKKGSLFLGGSISSFFETTKSGTAPEVRQHAITISPVVGKAIKDNLVIGASFEFDFNKYYSPTSAKGYTYGAGIFARKYKNIGNSGFYIFGQGNFGGDYSRQKTAGMADFTHINIYASAYPGLSYAVTKKLHLETGFNNLIRVSYYHEKQRQEIPVPTVYTRSGFTFSTSLNNATSNLFLGFRLIIGK
jgi:hypothetical protein